MAQQDPFDGVNDEVRELVEDMADDYGESPAGVLEKVRVNLSVDFTEISEEEAKQAREAMENDDVSDDQFWEVLAEHGDERSVTQYRKLLENGDMTMEETAGGGSGNETTETERPEPANDATPTPSSTPDGVSRGGGGGQSVPSGEQIEQKIDRLIDQKINEKLQGAGATSGGGGGGGGDDQMGAAILNAIMQMQGGGSGGGLGEKVQEHAVNNFVQKAFQPDPGEIMGRMMAMKQYANMAEDMGMDVDDEMMESQMKQMFSYGTGDDGEE